MSAVFLPGAEPSSWPEGTNSVLVLHGFTGQPYSVRSLAESFADAGFRVELPLLPGHGTAVSDLEPCRFHDWADYVDEIFRRLDRPGESTIVVGLSMGGTLACWLAEQHRNVAALILINPLINQTTRANMRALRSELRAGRTVFATPGSDVKKPGAKGQGYDATPIRPLLSLLEGAWSVEKNLKKIEAQVLLFSSREDHVVPPKSGDTIVKRVRGSYERVYLENSFHVATLDNDAPELEERAVAFARKVVER